ncbi:MAG TPA: hypothetical protein VIT67_06110, partial [Povalibacter sp.]
MSRFNLCAIMASLVCAVVFSSAHAGINAWTTKGPPGGVYLDFEASSTDPNVYYAAYGRSFHRSTDGGNNWQAHDFLGQVQQIVVDPADGNRIFVAVIDEGLFRSTDGGLNFTKIAPGSPRIWTAGVGPNNVVYYASELGFRRSNDGGDTFGPATPVQPTVEHIMVDSANAELVYAIRGPYFMRSINGGSTWSEQMVGLGDFNSLYSMVKLANGLLVVASGSGIYTSEDAVNWTQRASGTYSSVAVDPQAPQTLIATGFWQYQLARSVDGGLNWAPTGSGLQQPARRALISGASSSRLLIAHYQGVQLSDDGGVTWRYAARGPISSGGQLATTVAANARVYAYSDYGSALYASRNDSDWQRVSDGLAYESIGQASLAVKPGDSSAIFLGAFNRGVYRSADGGVSWSLPSSDLKNFSIDSLGFDPVNPSIMYASVSGVTNDLPPAGLYRSTNGGANWTPRSTNLPVIHAFHMAVDPADGSRIFLAGQQASWGGDVGGLYFSGDAGVTWNRVGFNQQNVWDVAIDPANSSRVYAATQTGLQVSTNGGTSFAVSDSFAIATDNMEAGSVVIDPVIPTTLYATGIDSWLNCCAPQRASAVLRSVDQGASWETLHASADSPTWFSGSMVLDPNTPSRIYVSTGLRGIASFEIVNDLSVTLSGHSGTRPLGQPSTFDLRVAHAGALAATGVRLVTTLPAGLQNVSATTDRGACAVSGVTLTCTIAVLRPAQVANIRVTYTPASAVLLGIVSALSAHEGDDVLPNNGAQASATAGEVVDLALATSSPSTSADHGGSLALAFTVTNGGPI